MNKFELTPKWPFFRKQTTVRDEVTGLIETFIDKSIKGFVLLSMLEFQQLRHPS